MCDRRAPCAWAREKMKAIQKRGNFTDEEAVEMTDHWKLAGLSYAWFAAKVRGGGN